MLLFKTPARETEYSSKVFSSVLTGCTQGCLMLLAEPMTEDRVPLAGLSVVPLWVWCAWWGWEDKGVIVYRTWIWNSLGGYSHSSDSLEKHPPRNEL